MELNCARKYETPQDLNFTKRDFHDLDYMEICENKKKKKKKKKTAVTRAINIFKKRFKQWYKECNKQGLYMINTFKVSLN